MKETTRIIDEDKAIIYNQNGHRHRENGPSFIAPTGYMSYRRNNGLCREDGLAVVWPDGTRDYYINGRFLGGGKP